MMISKVEKDCLNKLLEQSKLDNYDFNVYINDDKILLYISNNIEEDDDETLGYIKISTKLIPYIETIKILCHEVRISLEVAIGILNNMDYKWNPISSDKSKYDYLFYYYINNAILRLSILWDNLAQIYNILYNIGEKSDKIYTKNFFETNKEKLPKKQNISNILKYMNGQKLNIIDIENYDCECESYILLSKYRNQLTHRSHPNTFNPDYIDCKKSFGRGLPKPPPLITKYTVEDFYIFVYFYNTFLEEVKEHIVKK